MNQKRRPPAPSPKPPPEAPLAHCPRQERGRRAEPRGAGCPRNERATERPEPRGAARSPRPWRGRARRAWRGARRSREASTAASCRSQWAEEAAVETSGQPLPVSYALCLRQGERCCPLFSFSSHPSPTPATSAPFGALWSQGRRYHHAAEHVPTDCAVGRLPLRSWRPPRIRGDDDWSSRWADVIRAGGAGRQEARTHHRRQGGGADPAGPHKGSRPPRSPPGQQGVDRRWWSLACLRLWRARRQGERWRWSPWFHGGLRLAPDGPFDHRGALEGLAARGCSVETQHLARLPVVAVAAVVAGSPVAGRTACPEQTTGLLATSVR